MEYLAIVGGTNSNVNTHKLILDKQKHWRFVEHRGSHLILVTLFTTIYKHYMTNTTKVQIIYGILMKQEFKLVDNLEQEFWLREDPSLGKG